VRFVSETPTRRRVELEHRRLERRGEGCAAMHDAIDLPEGWGMNLGRFPSEL
jgi:hypothetical protein